jgi:major vault protein
MPDNTRGRERDLILAPNEYAYLLDETKGNVIDYVGPHKTSLANTDQPVIFNAKTKRFERCILEEAIQTFVIAPEGWYIVLKNPAKDGKPPQTGTANNLLQLDVGHKVNMPGPVSFALWPGQMVRIIQGHHLRSNQYLIVRVYDEDAAKANWGKAVMKPQRSGPSGSGEENGPSGPSSISGTSAVVEEMPNLTMGTLLVIKGTSVSFYIPPTGIEVVPDQNGNFVQNAVSLERLEYCILLDENGNKRYIKGPDVVFPKPTETFVQKNGIYKFKAVELNEIRGLYLKVIAAYEENGQKYNVGDELFITGKDMMIYFPRPEHAIIRYGDQEVCYAVAIPAGEARYVLHRLTGQISLKRGPCMFLPDPRQEIIVRRILEPRQVELWFPGNQDALAYNQRLLAMIRGKGGDAAVTSSERRAESASAPAPTGDGFIADEFSRKPTFTQPRTITLDTKYEGAVAINVWTGYAILVVSRTGERKVIAGPQSYVLEYNETLEPVELSTGTPKNDKQLQRTVYLRVLHNKVSDVVEAETADLCQVRVYLSYRVNFEGDTERWFNVENYVKFLTEHMRSLLRHAIKQHGIEPFYARAIEIIRNTILGMSNENGKRDGRLFSENGMRIYDVEVLDITIGDDVISELLTDAQHKTVEQTLELAGEKRNLEMTRQKEAFKQQIAEAEAQTLQRSLLLQTEEIKKRFELNLAKIDAEIQAEQSRLEAKVNQQSSLEKISQAELARDKARHDLDLAVAQQRLTMELDELQAGVAAVVDKAQAVSPELIAALQAFGDKALAEKMATAMAPLAILGGKSVAEVFGRLLQGTVLEKVLAPTPSSSKTTV